MRKLFSYFRSSAAYRVRIALELKQLSYEIAPIHLLRNGGEQNSEEYKRLNPMGLVPSFVDEDGAVVNQSLAIIEYLDEKYKDIPLLPEDPLSRSRVRSLALLIACDIHPVNNLRILSYLTNKLNADAEQRDEWYKHWIISGFDALEQQLNSKETGDFCHGDKPGLVDCCLIPQVYNANRFKVDMGRYKNIVRITENCEALPAFKTAHPNAQPDFEG